MITLLPLECLRTDVVLLLLRRRCGFVQDYRAHADRVGSGTPERAPWPRVRDNQPPALHGFMVALEGGNLYDKIALASCLVLWGL